MKALALALFLLLFSNSVAFSAESGISQLQPLPSDPEDRFAIGVPLGWNSRITASSRGRLYAFWDGTGNALTIDVGTPNSFEQLLTSISENKVSKTKLLEMQRVFRREAPLKLNVILSVSTIANKRTFTQSYIYRHETLGAVGFVSNISHDFLHKGKQYSISYSSPPASTGEAAESIFEISFQRYFKPMLVSFFVY